MVVRKLRLCFPHLLLLLLRRCACTGTNALALEGGGFRAFASDTGFLAGAMAAACARNASLKCSSRGSRASTPPRLLLDSGVLQGVDLISTVSGSSWFASELIYSNGFLAMVEDIAANPLKASAIFGAQFTQPWLQATNVDDFKFRALLALVRRLQDKAVTEDVELAAFFIVSGFTWSHFVDVLLNSTAGIGREWPINSAVNDWSAGKVWLCDHTAVLPQSPGATVYEGKALTWPRVTYSVTSSQPLPVFLPAKVSFRLGQQANVTAPLPYIAAAVSGAVSSISYEGVVIPPLVRYGSATRLMQGELGANITRFSGMLPISRVVAASSAFLGAVCLDGPLFNGILDVTLSGDLTPWVSAAPEGLAFEQAYSTVGGFARTGGVNRASIAAAAAEQLHGVIDGGESDGTGIAWAVASGAQSVFVLLNSNATNDPAYVAKLFPGGAQPVPRAAPLFPLFSSPSAVEVQGAFETFHMLSVPNESRFLKVFAFGSIPAVTADNMYFGVEKGRNVQLNIVSLGSAITIGALEDFSSYNFLAQEVVSTLTSAANAEFVHTVLLPRLRGAKRLGESHVYV